MNDDRDDALLEQRLAGHSARNIARQHRCTPADVDAAVDALPEIDNVFRVRSLKLALEQLDRLMIPFWNRAVVDKDVAAGMLVVKILERKSDLLGINSPTRIDPVSLAIAAQPTPSGTTHKIYDALARLGSNGSGSDSDAPPS